MSTLSTTQTEVETTMLVSPINITLPALPGASEPSQEEIEFIGALPEICYGPVKLTVPKHPSFAAHRAWMLTHAAAVFRYFARSGFCEGLSGHISIRDPEYPHCFWMNPLALHFGSMRASDFLLLSDDPDPTKPERILAVAGGASGGSGVMRPANKAGWAIHGAVHRARPDVMAACHAHTVAGKAWSATGLRLKIIDQDVCKFHGDALAVYDTYGGVVFGSAIGEGEGIARALGPRGKAAILSNHGLLTVGKTVDEAGYLFGLLEKSCRIQLELAKSGLPVREIADKEAKFNFEMEGSPGFLYWEFQPEYDYELAVSKGEFADVQPTQLGLDRLHTQIETHAQKKSQ